MKAILCSQYCQPDDLVLADVPDPVAGPGEAVIAIKAAALNFFDISTWINAYNSGDLNADFTGDGVFDFFDASAYLNEFIQGCM